MLSASKQEHVVYCYLKFQLANLGHCALLNPIFEMKVKHQKSDVDEEIEDDVQYRRNLPAFRGIELMETQKNKKGDSSGLCSNSV